MNRILKRNIIQHLGIIIGSIIFAIAYSWFLVPYKIAPGGVGGLSQILFHALNIPIGVSMIIFNIPLFVLSFLFLGKRFGLRSLFGMFSTSIFADLLSFKNLYNIGVIKDLSPFTFIDHGNKIYAMLSPDDIYLSAIAGSVLLGLGLGMIFRFRGSTGGTDIPVAFIKQKAGLSIGTGYWLVETLIILTVGIFFRDMKLVIWGYVNLFITTKLTDIASEGLPFVKGVYIISEKNQDIKEQIYEKIRRGVTFFKAQGGYTGKDMDVLFCAMNRRQIAMIRDIVRDIDPNAFMYLTEVYDVMGYGFRSRNVDLSDNGILE
ncbi:MAG: YitT family protein [Candidatus Cloacimonetes bacterium]|nr:YitT family protein [Candidatus Cloacimonadota bacterium]